jgi:glycosyltransferase involved in cell wall biosynthesis
MRAAAALGDAIDDTGVEVVHSNGTRSHVLLPVAHRRGVATVASIRDLPRSGAEAFVLRAALRSADAVIATSEYVRRTLRSVRGVRVIENPIEAPRLPDPRVARRDLGLPSGAFVVAMLAHFHWWKGHLDLLRAVEPVDDAWLLLAGGDLYGESSAACRNEVLAFARSHGFVDRVRWVGALDDVGPVYAAADVVAHCSVRPEPFGRTLVEAMLAGTPVVASAAGAPGEFIRDGRTGLLYAPGRSAELRAHLVALRDDRGRGAALARAARRDVGDRFAPPRHAARVCELYDDASSRRAGVRATGKHATLRSARSTAGAGRARTRS